MSIWEHLSYLAPTAIKSTLLREDSLHIVFQYFHELWEISRPWTVFYTFLVIKRNVTPWTIDILEPEIILNVQLFIAFNAAQSLIRPPVFTTAWYLILSGTRYQVCSVHIFTSYLFLMILGNFPTWRTNSFQCIYLFIVLYMSRACHAHHQEKKNVSIQLLLIVTPCWWQCHVLVGGKLVW